MVNDPSHPHGGAGSALAIFPGSASSCASPAQVRGWPSTRTPGARIPPRLAARSRQQRGLKEAVAGTWTSPCCRAMRYPRNHRRCRAAGPWLPIESKWHIVYPRPATVADRRRVRAAPIVAGAPVDATAREDLTKAGRRNSPGHHDFQPAFKDKTHASQFASRPSLPAWSAHRIARCCALSASVTAISRNRSSASQTATRRSRPATAGWTCWPGAPIGTARAGAMPQVFGTITISDGISMGTEGMKCSLVSREVIADRSRRSAAGRAWTACWRSAAATRTCPAR